LSWSISRVLFPHFHGIDDHSSGTLVADGLKQPTRSSNNPDEVLETIRSCTGWGLQAFYVTIKTGGLLHHPFTLTQSTNANLGGLLSAALSIFSRTPLVKGHPVLQCPDFPPCLQK